MGISTNAQREEHPLPAVRFLSSQAIRQARNNVFIAPVFCPNPPVQSVEKRLPAVCFPGPSSNFVENFFPFFSSFPLTEQAAFPYSKSYFSLVAR